MNIIFINPPITYKERYSSGIGVAGGHQLPLGICYLAAVLRQDGHNLRIIDAEAEEIFDYDEIISMIKSFNTEIIGITCCTVGFYRSLELAKKIKEKCNLPIILGGPHITALPEYSMSFKQFDYGILREGEITILELVKAIKNKKPVSRIKGIVYRNKKGQIKLTEPREFIKDLDSLPFPARDLVKMELYKPPSTNYKAFPIANIITSRGCPNQCVFCDRNIFGNRYREHSAERVVSEVEHLIENYGVKEVVFVDDTSLVNKKRMYDIMALMRKKGIKIVWQCQARVDNVDENLLRVMKDGGCWYIGFGIESGSQKVLDFIKKGITIEQIKKAIYLSKKAGIVTKGFFMLGHPIDTKETIEQTIKFAKSLPLTDIIVTLTTPIPNTELYKIARKYGSLDEQDWSKFNYWCPVFVPKGLTDEYLRKTLSRFYKEFYLRPSIIFNHLKQLNSLDNLKRLLTGFKAVLTARWR